MKKLLYRIWSRFLTAFGNIRISKYVPWLYYDSTDYKVTGDRILEIMEILRPGDCILRGYSNYLDGKFIDDPLKFSHGAIYVGDGKIIHAVAEGVSEINVIDFCQCDRIAIFRPKKGVRSAIRNARKHLGTGYDFLFSYGSNSIYCFELCALCYPMLDVKTVRLSKFLGLVKKNVYLAKSFFDSKDMKCVYHFNPKFNIDMAVMEDKTAR